MSEVCGVEGVWGIRCDLPQAHTGHHHGTYLVTGMEGRKAHISWPGAPETSECDCSPFAYTETQYFPNLDTYRKDRADESE